MCEWGRYSLQQGIGGSRMTGVCMSHYKEDKPRREPVVVRDVSLRTFSTFPRKQMLFSLPNLNGMAKVNNDALSKTRVTQ